MAWADRSLAGRRDTMAPAWAAMPPNRSQLQIECRGIRGYIGGSAGVAVSSLLIRDGVLWRQLTSCLVIYTLIIQGLLFGFAGAKPAGDSGPGFELCLNSGHGSPSADFPDGQAACNACIFCLASPHYGSPPPAFASSSRPYIIAANPPMLGDWRRPPQTQQPGAPPRGPPPFA